MQTQAVRLYGANDLRLETFDLPPIGEDGVLAKVISDTLCMSSYKEACQGIAHKRVPADIATNPIVIGHEFCGKIVEVGAKWRDRFEPGDQFAIQPAHFYHGSLAAPGYSYPYCGGDATYVIIPMETLEMNCLLKYKSDAYFHGSLAEPLSCIIAAFHAMYHTAPGSHVHSMGIAEGGKMALLASAGPMGLGAVDYALHCSRRPKHLVVTDIDSTRLSRAQSLYTVAHAKECGVDLSYVNTGELSNPVESLMNLTDGAGFDDVLCFAPARSVVEQADAILGLDGCLNFFSGPSDTRFTAALNFYQVHYASHHILGTTGGNTEDMREAIDLMSKGLVNPAAMITHIGGLDCVAETTNNLPHISGGKKLIYTHLRLPLTAIADFERLGSTDPLFAQLHQIVSSSNGLWCSAAEKLLLAQEEL